MRLIGMRRDAISGILCFFRLFFQVVSCVKFNQDSFGESCQESQLIASITAHANLNAGNITTCNGMYINKYNEFHHNCH